MGAPPTVSAMKTILVARDNALARLRLKTMLRGAGYRVIAVATGRQALTAMLTQRPDLALLDLQMPGLDGAAVVEAMRTDPRLRTVPRIALSGLSRQLDRELALAAGFNGYLHKPVARAKLMAEVRRWIEEDELAIESPDGHRTL